MTGLLNFVRARKLRILPFSNSDLHTGKNGEYMDDKFKESDPEDSGASMTINLSYSLTRSDLFWYNIYFVKWLVIGAVVFFTLAITAFVIALKTPSGDLKTTIIWAVMGFGVGFSICAGSVAAILLQIFFVNNETVNKAMTRRSYIINSAGIAVFNEQGKITRTWKDIKSIIKTRHGYYIKTGDKIAIVIPRQAFASQSDLEIFKELVKLAKT